MSLESRDLHIFMSVCNHGSIGRAATEFGMTQPGVSRIIRKLETSLGTPLFERHPLGVRPTAAAEALLPHATSIVASAHAAAGEVAMLSGRGHEVVRIGATVGIVSSLLCHAINRLLAKWPNMRIYLIEGLDDELSEALARCVIDIAIGSRMQHYEVPLARPDQLIDSAIVVASPQHPLSRVGKADLAELTRHKWVLPTRSLAQVENFDTVFHRAGLTPPEPAVETLSLATASTLVASGNFLAWMPRSFYTYNRIPSQMVAIDVPELMLDFSHHIYRRANSVLAPAARKLLDEMRELCRNSPLRE